MEKDFVTIALPKGRLLKESLKLLEKAGIWKVSFDENGRKLIYADEQAKLRCLICRTADVPTFVEHGAADLGIAGKDVILEQGKDICELLDLGFGKCRFVVAAPVSKVEQGDFEKGLAGYLAQYGQLRVATKFPRVAQSYLRKEGLPGEVIKLSGNIELAPLVGLADVIVDLVSTGRTLKENNLVPVAEVAQATARLIANRVSYRLKHRRLIALVNSIQECLRKEN
ncbi:MAG: ATP phosphoribosyltransferase [Thermoanaerobacterales bacterium 50_218]|nr:MAG: ATP phosphoribosyltransferase [Thermoanaerobacterales bacterium 50_218]HAA90728.1 ATP phosphoribosyltransferase [Peptococcaceae bacterium]